MISGDWSCQSSHSDNDQHWSKKTTKILPNSDVSLAQIEHEVFLFETFYLKCSSYFQKIARKPSKPTWDLHLPIWWSNKSNTTNLSLHNLSYCY